MNDSPKTKRTMNDPKKKPYDECAWLVKKSFRFWNFRRKNKILTYILFNIYEYVETILIEHNWINLTKMD